MNVYTFASFAAKNVIACKILEHKTEDNCVIH